MPWTRWIAVVANALLMGAVLTEGLARVVFTDFYACDERVGWVFDAGRSGFRIDRGGEYALRVKINQAGFNDVEHAAAADPDTIRIVLLGDSMLAGLQVPVQETFARRLERELNAWGGARQRFEVLNCATDGYGTAQQWLTFRERCAAYRPQLVVLGTFLWNDLADNHPAVGSLNHPIAYKCGRPYFKLEAGQLAPAEDALDAREPSAASRLDRLLRHSYLYQIGMPTPGYSQRIFTHKHVFRRGDVPTLTEAWQITDALIRALATDVAKQGGRLAVMAVPSRPEIEGRMGTTLEPAAELDLEGPHQRLLELLAAARIPAIDPAPALRVALERESQPPYFQRDLHWTSQGNEVVAHFVARWIEEHCAELGLPARACADPVATTAALPD